MQVQYASFLLRIWRSITNDQITWRVSLEDTRNGTRQGFADLAAAFAFLEAHFPNNSYPLTIISELGDPTKE